MSSISGRFLDKPTQAAYAASKAGVTMFTRHLALEVGPAGVRANVVAPATTMSERIERVMDDASIAKPQLSHHSGRLGLPEDTASATFFLLSGASSWLTGVTLDVAGGRVMLWTPTRRRWSLRGAEARICGSGTAAARRVRTVIRSHGLLLVHMLMHDHADDGFNEGRLDNRVLPRSDTTAQKPQREAPTNSTIS